MRPRGGYCQRREELAPRHRGIACGSWDDLGEQLVNAGCRKTEVRVEKES